MVDEYTALLKNQTWDLVPPPPKVTPIGCKWIYKIKLRSDGTLERYKARLVAKGFHQRPGIDYTETFSPVVKPVTIRTVLSLAYSKGWTIRQLDVKNAFLHGNLDEEVFMQQPQGFVDPQKPNFVCRLRRSLYGLKQAPRAWNHRLTQFLQHIGFSISKADSSLFYLHTTHHTILLLVYVDDIILTGTPNAPLTTILNQLQQEFDIKDLGDLHYFLGIEALPTSDGLLLHQAKFAQDILQRAHMDNARGVSTPCATGHPPSIHDGEPFSDPTHYRSIVGALQYLTLTRPDIAYAVNTACQYMHAPTNTHWIFVKRILRFLADTPRYGIQLTRSLTTQLHAYSDAGWAGDCDDRRSTGGFCVFLGANLISWRSRKQKTVARSSTEAEFKSLADTAAELIWIEALLRDLHQPLSTPPTLWCDNLSALYLSTNPVFHARTKHVEIDFHFIRERIKNQQLNIHFISSVDQPADIFTKGLSSSRFSVLQAKLTVRCDPLACGGISKTQSTRHVSQVNSATSPSLIHATQHVEKVSHVSTSSRRGASSPSAKPSVLPGRKSGAGKVSLLKKIIASPPRNSRTARIDRRGW